MTRAKRYADYAKPRDILHDARLSRDQKRAALKDWQAAILRLRRLANPDNDPSLDALLSEIDRIQVRINGPSVKD